MKCTQIISLAMVCALFAQFTLADEIVPEVNNLLEPQLAITAPESASAPSPSAEIPVLAPIVVDPASPPPNGQESNLTPKAPEPPFDAARREALCVNQNAVCAASCPNANKPITNTCDLTTLAWSCLCPKDTHLNTDQSFGTTSFKSKKNKKEQKGDKKGNKNKKDDKKKGNKNNTTDDNNRKKNNKTKNNNKEETKDDSKPKKASKKIQPWKFPVPFALCVRERGQCIRSCYPHLEPSMAVMTVSQVIGSDGGPVYIGGNIGSNVILSNGHVYNAWGMPKIITVKDAAGKQQAIFQLKTNKNKKTKNQNEGKAAILNNNNNNNNNNNSDGSNTNHDNWNMRSEDEDFDQDDQDAIDELEVLKHASKLEAVGFSLRRHRSSSSFSRPPSPLSLAGASSINKNALALFLKRQRAQKKSSNWLHNYNLHNSNRVRERRRLFRRQDQDALAAPTSTPSPPTPLQAPIVGVVPPTDSIPGSITVPVVPPPQVDQAILLQCVTACQQSLVCGSKTAPLYRGGFLDRKG